MLALCSQNMLTSPNISMFSLLFYFVEKGSRHISKDDTKDAYDAYHLNSSWIYYAAHSSSISYIDMPSAKISLKNANIRKHESIFNVMSSEEILCGKRATGHKTHTQKRRAHDRVSQSCQKLFNSNQYLSLEMSSHDTHMHICFVLINEKKTDALICTFHATPQQKYSEKVFCSCTKLKSNTEMQIRKLLPVVAAVAVGEN